MSRRKITIEEIIEKFIKVHGLRYLYDMVVCNSYRDKVTIGCRTHGYFEQSISNHISGNGCPKCKFDYLASLRKLTTEEFIKRATLIHGNRYDYSKVVYIDSYTPVIIICKIHGEFLTTPNSHLQGCNCIKCKYDDMGNLLRLTEDELIERANKVHMNRYTYPRIRYINMTRKITVTCGIHGDFEQSPINHLTGSGCPSCRSSRGEHCIENILIKNNIKFIREYILPNQQNKYRYDFYLPDLNLLIEFHGIQHFQYVPFFHNNNFEEFTQQKLYDKIKKDIAKSLEMLFLEFNYKQLKHMSIEDFEAFVSEKIVSICLLN